MEIVIETCLDSIKMLPFLFFAFLLIEFLELSLIHISEPTRP